MSCPQINESRGLSRAPGAVVLVSVVFMQACSHVQDVPESPIGPADNARRLEQRSLQADAVAAALARYGLAMPANNQWSVDQLTVAAWTLNADVALARAELTAAESATTVASLSPEPTLDVNMERVVGALSGSPWVLGAGLGFLVEPAGKPGIRRQRALATERVLRARLGATLWTVCHAVRKAALDRRLADDTLALDDAEIRLRREYLDWIGTRLALGAANSQDRLQAAQALSVIESQRRIDEAARASASLQLASYLGISPEQFDRISLDVPASSSLPDPVLENAGEARDLALANRLDIRRALAEYDVAEQDLRAAVAGRYPDTGLGPGYLYDQGDHKVTLNASLPLNLHGTVRAKVDKALADRRVAARRFDQVQAAALSAIDNGHALVLTMQAAVDSALQAEAVADAALRTTRDRLAAGAANRGDVLAAELVLQQRRRDTLAARQRLLEAVSKLEDAVEKPLYPRSSLATPDPDTVEGTP